jgi:hypothetical protein
MSPDRNGQVQAAFVASKKVFGVCSARNSGQGRSLFEVDPTTGALVVRPEHRLKVEKALRREAKRIYLRLLFRRLRLQIDYFALQRRLALLIVFRDLRGIFTKLFSNRHA